MLPSESSEAHFPLFAFCLDPAGKKSCGTGNRLFLCCLLGHLHLYKFAVCPQFQQRLLQSVGLQHSTVAVRLMESQNSDFHFASSFLARCIALFSRILRFFSSSARASRV